MKFVRIYNGNTMKLELTISCPGVILAIEYVSDKNAICVSLSDRTFLFYDASSTSYKQMRKFNLPSTQPEVLVLPTSRERGSCSQLELMEQSTHG